MKVTPRHLDCVACLSRVYRNTPETAAIALLHMLTEGKCDVGGIVADLCFEHRSWLKNGPSEKRAAALKTELDL